MQMQNAQIPRARGATPSAAPPSGNVRAIRDVGASRDEIQKLVEQRMRSYENANAPPGPSTERKVPERLQSIPGMTGDTKYLVVVKNDLPQCQELVSLINQYASHSALINVQDVSHVKAHANWLRGVPTILSVTNQRLYEGTGALQFAKQILPTLGTGGSQLNVPVTGGVANAGGGGGGSGPAAVGGRTGSTASSSLMSLYGRNFKSAPETYNKK